MASTSSARASAQDFILSASRNAGGPMETADPFLFAVYHDDAYPAGDRHMRAPMRGDGAHFDPSAPYRMYHGTEGVPGFPHHPHRGFETITVVKKGVCDHTDSLGSAGRYGAGDMQWMHAGGGIVHGEMFPLVRSDAANPLQLYQIWLNLPPESKVTPAGYSMYWGEDQPRVKGSGGAEATVVVGTLGDVTTTAGVPPAHSWGADPAHDVGVFTITLPPGGSASFTVPPAVGGARVSRSVHFAEAASSGVSINGAGIPGLCTLIVKADVPLVLTNASPTQRTEVLILQGQPIGAPVAQRGPFVMNTQAELAESFALYRRTEFGGWPWADEAPVFPPSRDRFSAKPGPDGGHVFEYPPSAAPAEGDKLVLFGHESEANGGVLPRRGGGGGKSEL